MTDLVVGASTQDSAFVVAVVLARLLVPLLIPRIPLVIVVVLVLDAVDQTLLATFTDVDTSETGSYQSVDKALDIYYLSIGYLATLRNWTSIAAFRIAQFLFSYRLVGVVLFELTDDRLMLLLFPNTFEYFFIAYEIARSRYEPSRFSARFWLLVAAGLWIFVKLPQEYWIHIAKLDFTDTVRDYPAFGVAVVVALIVAAVVVVFVVVPRLPVPDWSWRVGADPLPSSLDEAHELYAHRLERGRVLTREALEQVWLLSLLCIIFASILPGIDATSLQIAAGATAIVLANAAISLAAARRGGFGLESAAARYAALLATNLVLVFLANALLGERRDFELGYGLFFAFLITTIIWLYDAFKPVHDQRFGTARAPARTAGSDR
ncbi:MAG TPA: hypothetical protein VNO82_25215 [Solirubrobacteraceae bacterium]|nr:hypothetical protein [Solirubrobacteraceae bacterium]